MLELLSKLSALHLKESYLYLLKESVGHPERIARVERGYRILTESSEYSITLSSKSPITFSVMSPNETYRVIESEKVCTCPDTEPICKHRFAVKLILDAIKRMKRDGVRV